MNEMFELLIFSKQIDYNKNIIQYTRNHLDTRQKFDAKPLNK